MKIKNEYGLLQIFLSYFILWIPFFLKKHNNIFFKDYIFIAIIISVLVMVDAKMKYKNKFVIFNFYIMLILFVFLLYASIIIHE